MIIAVYGGGFDPPHVCHLLVCQYALATEEIDRLLVIPTYRHPFDKPMAPFEDRLEMCRLAWIDQNPRIEISDMEARHDGVSYTIDTLERLRAQFPGAALRLIVGSDNLREADRWKDFERIKRIAPLLVVGRGESARREGFRFLLPDLSSTMIRDLCRKGQWPSDLVPRRTLAYIRQKGLYAR